jgi:DNA-binding Lrp family transcriptional regulator
MYKLSKLDKKILKHFMQGLPLAENPYSKIGERLGLSGDFVFRRMQKLKEAGIIKNINTIFNWQKLGYRSSLMAIKAPIKKLKKIAEFINDFGSVTHNYLRRNKFNLWFFFIYKKEQEKQNLLEGLNKLGVREILDLPSLKKIKLDTLGLV